jgi:hypothetical protein
MSRPNPRLLLSDEQEARQLIRQVASPTWDDPNYWKFGERGDILCRLHRLGPITRKVWLAATFTDPDKTQVAIWTYAAEGNRILEDELSVCANLPRNATYQDLANLIVEYSLTRFGNAVVDGMAKDIRNANATDVLSLDEQNA